MSPHKMDLLIVPWRIIGYYLEFLTFLFTHKIPKFITLLLWKHLWTLN